MAVQYFLVYFTIMSLATITPGPSMLMALNHGANYGLRNTIYSGLGNSIANLIMAFVSFAGLGVILMASGIVFNIIKWLGIAYLVYLGVMLIIKSPDISVSTEESSFKIKHKTRFQLFLEGFLIAIGNPKGIIFFTALFPQFIQSGTSFSGLFLVFFSLVAVAFICYMLYAFAGKNLNRLFSKKYFKQLFNRISGAIFIGTGLALAFSKK